MDNPSAAVERWRFLQVKSRKTNKATQCLKVSNGQYTVLVRGPLPKDLAAVISGAHAQAICQSPNRPPAKDGGRQAAMDRPTLPATVQDPRKQVT